MFWKKRKNKKEENNDARENAINDPREFFEKDEIVNYLSDGLLVFNNYNKLVLINPRAEEFFKVKSEEVLGSSIFDLNRFFNFKSLVSLLGGAMEKCFRKELRINEGLALEVTTNPIMIKDEKAGNLVILHDVTREKLVERMKNEFVALAAHQLRTPTSAIKWSLMSLLDEDIGRLNPEQKKLIEKTYAVTERAIKLINNLLDITQIEEGGYIVRAALVDIVEIVQSAIESRKEAIEIKKIRLLFNKPEENLPEVMMDAEKIKIAVENIIDNAVRYTAAGGEISIFIREYQTEIEVEVKDNGIGIPLAEQEKIFSLFFRASNVLKLDPEGTGLGLFITKNIIEAHSGRIRFVSKENEGSSFYFAIPKKGKFSEYLTEEFY